VRDRSCVLERPAHKQPASARLGRDVHDPTWDPLHPPLDRRRRGIKLTVPQLAGRGIQRVERDLATMHVETRDDCSRSDAENKGRAHHRLRRVTPDRCHTVIHGRYLQLRMTGERGLQPRHAISQRRSTRRTGDLPPGQPGTLRPWLLMSSFGLSRWTFGAAPTGRGRQTSTPTPQGFFPIIGAWAEPPSAFLGSWILPLTAHSNGLGQFDGGDGTVGSHGRGGASLLDPLGTASRHGCIRVANSLIDWIVHSIAAGRLPGPVRVDRPRGTIFVGRSVTRLEGARPASYGRGGTRVRCPW